MPDEINSQQELINVSDLAEPLRDWVSQEIDSLIDFAIESNVDFYDALNRIEKNLRHCKPKSAESFVMWACRQISKCPGFTSSVKACHELDLNVLDLLAGMRRADAQPFEAIRDGNCILVNMGVHNNLPRAWKLPTDKTITIADSEYSWAEAAEKLWPCFLENDRVMTKIRGVNIHVARILLGARDDEQIRFANGNKLDYTRNNPFVVSSSGTDLQRRFDDKVMRYGTNSDVERVPNHRDREEMPAKSIAPKPTISDSQSIDDLRSGDFRSRNNQIVEAGPTATDLPHKPDLWGYEADLNPKRPQLPAKKAKGSVTKLFCPTCKTVNSVTKSCLGVYTLYCGHSRPK